MGDLAGFVADMLAEEERLAQAATPAPWTVVDVPTPMNVGTSFEISSPASEVAGEGYDGGGVWGRADADHIAHHDPARALALVAAGRAILAEHCAPGTFSRDAGYRDPEWWSKGAHRDACVGCGMDGMGDPEVEHRDDCPTLRAFALTWAGHERYDEEWRPE